MYVVDKPKDQDLVGHTITKLHLTSSLTFLKANIQETRFLSFFTGPSKSEISAHFALFSLKERARKLLRVSLESTGSHTKRKISLHLISYLTLSKQLQQLRTLSVTPQTPKGLKHEKDISKYL